MKYLICLSYCGRNFCGFQVQNKSNDPTIQGALCDAAKSIFGVDCLVSGCSRTDSGVHANEYYATLEADAESSVTAEKLPRALNAFLPRDIVVSDARCVPDDFSVRRNVISKEYEYLILNSAYPSPFYVGTAWYYGARRLDEEKMARAAAGFCGTHDFLAFASSGLSVSDTVRTVEYVNVIRDGDFVKIRIRADGFLYNMARAMVGTVVYAAEGKIKPAQIGEILESGNRTAAGPTVPPGGLYMTHLWYDDGIEKFECG